MTTSLDHWTGIARGYPFTEADNFDIVDLLDTPDGFVLLMNRTENNSAGAERPPELTFMYLLKVSFDATVIWHIAVSARDPHQGPEPVPHRTVGSSVVRARDGNGFLVAGFVSKRLNPSRDEARMFVCRIDDCGLLQWIKTYTDAAGDSAKAISIAALDTAPSDPPRYMVAAQGAGKDVERFAHLGPAWVIVIDDNGDVIGNGVRHYGLEVVWLARMRVLPTYGPVLVGQTFERHPRSIQDRAWVLRVNGTGAPVSEGVFVPHAICNYPNTRSAITPTPL